MDKINKEIENSFDKIIKRIEDQKRSYQDEYSKKFQGFNMGFETMFNGYYQCLKEVGKMES